MNLKKIKDSLSQEQLKLMKLLSDNGFVDENGDFDRNRVLELVKAIPENGRHYDTQDMRLVKKADALYDTGLFDKVFSYNKQITSVVCTPSSEVLDALLSVKYLPTGYSRYHTCALTVFRIDKILYPVKEFNGTPQSLFKEKLPYSENGVYYASVNLGDRLKLVKTNRPKYWHDEGIILDNKYFVPINTSIYGVDKTINDIIDIYTKLGVL